MLAELSSSIPTSVCSLLGISTDKQHLHMRGKRRATPMVGNGGGAPAVSEASAPAAVAGAAKATVAATASTAAAATEGPAVPVTVQAVPKRKRRGFDNPPSLSQEAREVFPDSKIPTEPKPPPRPPSPPRTSEVSARTATNHATEKRSDKDAHTREAEDEPRAHKQRKAEHSSFSIGDQRREDQSSSSGDQNTDRAAQQRKYDDTSSLKWFSKGCIYVNRIGGCRYGASCKFSHDHADKRSRGRDRDPSQAPNGMVDDSTLLDTPAMDKDVEQFRQDVLKDLEDQKQRQDRQHQRECELLTAAAVVLAGDSTDLKDRLRPRLEESIDALKESHRAELEQARTTEAKRYAEFMRTWFTKRSAERSH